MLRKLLQIVFGWFGRVAGRLLRRPWFGRLVVSIPRLHSWINNLAINRIVGQTSVRPHPYSTMSPYTSWSSLTDKSWSGRHLGESNIDQGSLPDPEELKALFARPNGKQRLCPVSTCLFPAFAQYLTDGFLRTWSGDDPATGEPDLNRRKRNSSNHEIDMCTLYGRNPSQTQALRVLNPEHDKRGMLLSQFIDGEEYPPFLYDGDEVDSVFKVLDPPLGIGKWLEACENEDPEISRHAKRVRSAVFAVGGDRVNSVPQVSLINTLWLREHNRLARELGRLNPSWDDDHVFEISRNIVIVQFIKVVVEDYINHISPIAVPLKADPRIAWKAPWNRPNWITTEFSLIYRWHSLIPDQIVWGGAELAVDPSYFLNNLPLLSVGLKKGFEDLSAQSAAELGPQNTTKHLLKIEIDSIQQGRACKLQSYNAYRKHLGRDRVRSFDEISSNPEVARMLSKTYRGDVENVEFFVGIFCEDRVDNSPLPQSILTMVGVDAFSQALPNPLLSRQVFVPPKEDLEDQSAFTSYGWGEIQSCQSLRDIVVRNISDTESLGFVAMTKLNRSIES